MIDANGHYSLTGIPWTGLTEVVVSGRYFDEAANADSAGTLDLTALIDLQAGATVRVNLLTHLLAGRIRVLMAGSQTYAAARTQALADLATRFNLTLAGGVGPEALDLTDGAGAHAQDNANLLLLSAAILAGGQGSQAAIDALRADFADNSRIDQAGFNAIRRAARAQNLATLRTRLMTRNATFANPPGSINQLPIWSLGGSLTDTGITTCYQAGSNTLVSCASAEAQALSTTQDGMIGRDADPTINSDADGKLGFSYSKLGGDGQPLVIQNATYSETGSEAAGTKWSCVKDNLTGLIWEVKTDDGGLRDKDNRYTNYDDPTQPQKGDASNPTQSEIDAATNSRGFVAVVNATSLCGYNDWRLPTPEELQGLVDYSVADPDPSPDVSFFLNTNSGTFWSSSPVAGFSSNAWSVVHGNFGSGTLRGDGRAVRLVRASQQQEHHFVISADGQEVTDQASGLIWRRCTEGMTWDGTTCAGAAQSLTHENALIRARTEATASGKAWRLPNVKELSSIVDRGRTLPAIDVAAFPANPSTWFWSSSPYAGNSDGAWGVDFGYGNVDGDGDGDLRDDYGAVRLVRASQ